MRSVSAGWRGTRTGRDASMSHRPGLNLLRNEQFGHAPSRRRATITPVTPQQRRTDFALSLGGRHVRLGPVAFWIVVGTLVIMAGWSITTATYFAFRDDVLARLVARETEMQFAYE